MKTTKPAVRLFEVKGCHSCPNITTRRIGGFAEDYICKATGSLVAAYVEWESEKQSDGDFPKNCPLKKAR